jgi:transposase InsO family protein
LEQGPGPTPSKPIRLKANGAFNIDPSRAITLIIEGSFAPTSKVLYHKKGVELIRKDQEGNMTWWRAVNNTHKSQEVNRGDIWVLRVSPHSVKGNAPVPWAKLTWGPISRRNPTSILAVTNKREDELDFGRMPPENGLVDLEEMIRDLKRREKLEEMVKINPNLSPKERKEILDIVLEFPDVYAVETNELGVVPGIEFEINIKPDAKPVHRNAYNFSTPITARLKKAVQELVDMGVVSPSNSDWSSPAILVVHPMKNDRLCIDYREANLLFIRDAFPMPRVDVILNQLAGKRFFSAFDAKKGYFQIKVKEEHRKFLAFITSFGLFEFKVMPFGIKTAPAFYQRISNEIAQVLEKHGVTIYLDDILVPSETWEDHLLGIRAVLMELRRRKIMLAPTKCLLGYTRMRHLGHTISAEGIETNDDKIRAMASLPPPTNKKGVRSLLGMFQYYSRFMKDLFMIAAPLFDTLKKERKIFSWGTAEENAFDSLKQLLVQPPVLAHFKWDADHEISTDASAIGIGAVLWQLEEGKKNVVAYLSKKFSDTQRNWPIVEREGYAIIWAVKKLEPLLYGKHFIIKTDHCSLCELFHGHKMKSKVARWAMSIADHDFTVQYVRGHDNPVADCLSRHPPQEIDPIETFEYLMYTGLKNRDVAIDREESREVQFKPKDWQKLQAEDPFCSRAIQWLTVFKSDPVKDTGEYQGLEMKDDKLHKNILDRWGVPQRCLVLPVSVLPEVMREIHSGPEGGHGGVIRTVRRILGRYWWPRLTSTINEYVKSCRACQQNKSPTISPAGLMQITTTPESPFDHWAMDVMGPFREGKKSGVGKFKYLIVIVDLFSRWVVAKATTDQKAPTVIEFLKKRVFSKFGYPRSILTDRGPNFLSIDVKKLFEASGIMHFTTTAYHQQANAKVERVNKMIGEALRCYVGRKGNEWPNHIPTIIHALNTSYCTPIDMTPFMAVYGKEARSRMDNEFGWTQSFLEEVWKKDQERDDFLYFVRCYAACRMEVQKWDNKKRYDKHRRDVSYLAFQLVLKKREGADKNMGGKLKEKFEGPYIVLKRKSFLNYQILKVKGGTLPIVVHVSKLKPFVQRGLKPTPVREAMEEALQDHPYFGKKTENEGRNVPPVPTKQGTKRKGAPSSRIPLCNDTPEPQPSSSTAENAPEDNPEEEENSDWDKETEISGSLPEPSSTQSEDEGVQEKGTKKPSRTQPDTEISGRKGKQKKKKPKETSKTTVFGPTDYVTRGGRKTQAFVVPLKKKK